MASHYYWIPQNHAELHSQAHKTWNYFSVHRERMGLAPTTPQGRWIDEEFYPQLCHFSEVFLDWGNPAQRTLAMTERLRSAEKTFKPAYRQFYISYLKPNPQVTNEDLVDMSLPKRTHREGYRYATMPGNFPQASIVLPDPAIVEFHFRDAGSTHKAKPAGVHGAEIRWAILDAPTKEWSELTHSSFAIHTPHRLTFEHHQRGETLYYALRWESTRGEKGPWSEIRNAIIP
jgi:hypothetical protein